MHFIYQKQKLNQTQKSEQDRLEEKFSSKTKFPGISIDNKLNWSDPIDLLQIHLTLCPKKKQEYNQQRNSKSRSIYLIISVKST